MPSCEGNVSEPEALTVLHRGWAGRNSVLSGPVQARPMQKCLHFESWGIVLIRKENIAGRERGRNKQCFSNLPTHNPVGSREGRAGLNIKV